MFKRELNFLKRDKFYILVICVLFFVPSLYAVPFLGSLWDTYGNVDQLPVALVNKDQPVSYQGQKLAVGDELVHELKKEKPLKIHYVSEHQAQTGLKDGRYYMAITIPKQFSNDATTLLEQKPKQMTLHYDTSSGHSFIGGKLSESAAKQIQGQVATSVTKAYTKAMMTEVKKSGKGVAQAAAGNAKLADGAKQVADGSQKLSDNLGVLASSSLAFVDGAQQLKMGLNQYVNGVKQAQNGSAALDNGLSQLQGRVPSLQNGVTQLAAGQTTLTNGLNQYTDAVGQAANGSQKVTQGLQALNQTLQSANLKDKTTVLKKELAELDAALAALDKQGQSLPNISRLENQVGQLKTLMNQLDQAKAADNQAMQAAIKDLGASAHHGGTLSDEEVAAVQATVAKQTEQSHQRQILNQLQAAMPQLLQEVEPLLSQAGSLENTLAGLKKQPKPNVQAINQSLDQVAALPSAVQQLTAGSQQLTGGLQTLHGQAQPLMNGAVAVQGGLQTLKQELPALTSGVSQLRGGASQLNSGLATLTGNSGQLLSGSGQLANGAQQMQDGANQLFTGSKQLTPAVDQIEAGNDTLANKLGTAADKVKQLPADKNFIKQFAQPTGLKHKEHDRVANNGTGMAPYMFSVGLYVGMLGINLMLNMVDPRGKITSVWAWIGTKVSILLGIATMMALVLFGLSQWILGMHFVNPMATLGFLIVMAWMDAFIVTALYMWFGRAGAFAAVVLLIAQLSLSAGTYPIQLSPAIYQQLHWTVPMTYTVDGLREVMMISGSAWPQVQAMAGFMLVGFVLMLAYYLLHKRRYDNTYGK